MRAGAKSPPRVDHHLGHARPHGRLFPRWPHPQLPAHEQRHVEALPALLPVVGHLFPANLHAHAAQRGRALWERGQLAGRAVQRELHEACPIHLLEAGRRDLEQRGQHLLRRLRGRAYGEPDQLSARLTRANSDSRKASSWSIAAAISSKPLGTLK